MTTYKDVNDAWIARQNGIRKLIDLVAVAQNLLEQLDGSDDDDKLDGLIDTQNDVIIDYANRLSVLNSLHQQALNSYHSTKETSK